MREILFRAKQIDDGEWVEGYYAMMVKENLIRHYIIQNCALTGLFDDPEENMYFNDVEINPETLCQFTGLTDKNGKRIWENDILHVIEKMGNNVYHNGSLISAPRWRNESDFKVEFTPGSLMNVQRFVNDLNIECEIIGNVFDNPELLKG